MSVRRALQWVRLAAVVAACVGVAAGAWLLRRAALEGFASFESPYEGAHVGAAKPTAPVASQVVLVVIDGLRADASREMGTFSMLRDHGADFTVAAPRPAYAPAGWSALLTGAPAILSGVVGGQPGSRGASGAPRGGPGGASAEPGGRVGVETLFDTAASIDATCAFVGGEGFERLFSASEVCDVVDLTSARSERPTAAITQAAIDIAERTAPRLLVVHYARPGEVGLSYGAASKEYDLALAEVDAGLRTLVEGLQDEQTTFVVVSSHGLSDEGTSGGWEEEVAALPCVFVGSTVRLKAGEGSLVDVTAAVAGLAGLPVPRHNIGDGMPQAVELPEAAVAARDAQRLTLVRTLQGPAATETWVRGTSQEASVLDAQLQAGAAEQTPDRREERLPFALTGLVVSLVVLMLVAGASWRAFVATLVGSATYFALFDGVYFGVRGLRWSLSAVGTGALSAQTGVRLADAVVAGVLAAAVAGAVYPLLRRSPKAASGDYLVGWLTLGPSVALVTLALLGMQVSWFVWAWGIESLGRLMDPVWGPKFLLDLLQASALGVVAIASPLVTWLVGRYHPKVRVPAAEE